MISVPSNSSQSHKDGKKNGSIVGKIMIVSVVIASVIGSLIIGEASISILQKQTMSEIGRPMVESLSGNAELKGMLAASPGSASPRPASPRRSETGSRAAAVDGKKEDASKTGHNNPRTAFSLMSLSIVALCWISALVTTLLHLCSDHKHGLEGFFRTTFCCDHVMNDGARGLPEEDYQIKWLAKYFSPLSHNGPPGSFYSNNSTVYHKVPELTGCSKADVSFRSCHNRKKYENLYIFSCDFFKIVFFEIFGIFYGFFTFIVIPLLWVFGRRERMSCWGAFFLAVKKSACPCCKKVEEVGKEEKKDCCIEFRQIVVIEEVCVVALGLLSICITEFLGKKVVEKVVPMEFKERFYRPYLSLDEKEGQRKIGFPSGHASVSMTVCCYICLSRHKQTLNRKLQAAFAARNEQPKLNSADKQDIQSTFKHKCCDCHCFENCDLSCMFCLLLCPVGCSRIFNGDHTLVQIVVGSLMGFGNAGACAFLVEKNIEKCPNFFNGVPAMKGNLQE